MPNSTRATSVRPAPTSPAKPDDLARADREADVLERARPGQAGHLQEDVADRALDPREQRDGAPDHVPDQVRGRELGRRSGDHVAAVAQHGRLVAQLEDLVEAMADEQDRDAAIAEPADDREETRDLVRRQRCGRLVEDQDAGVERQRPGDLDQLLVGHRQAADQRLGVERDVELLEQRVRAAAASRPSRSVRNRPGGTWPMKTFSATRQVREQAAAPGGRRRCRAPARRPGRGGPSGPRRARASPNPADGSRRGSWRACSCRPRSRRRAPGSRRRGARAPTSVSAWVAPNCFEIADQRDRRWRVAMAPTAALRPIGHHHGAGPPARSRAIRRPVAARSVRPAGRRRPRSRSSRTIAAGASRRVTTAVRSGGPAERRERGPAPLRVVDEADDLGRAPSTMRRLICASSSVASLRPASIANPAAPMNAFWMLTFSNSPSPSGPTRLRASQRTNPPASRR